MTCKHEWRQVTEWDEYKPLGTTDLVEARLLQTKSCILCGKEIMSRITGTRAVRRQSSHLCYEISYLASIEPHLSILTKILRMAQLVDDCYKARRNKWYRRLGKEYGYHKLEEYLNSLLSYGLLTLEESRTEKRMGEIESVLWPKDQYESLRGFIPRNKLNELTVNSQEVLTDALEKAKPRPGREIANEVIYDYLLKKAEELQQNTKKIIDTPSQRRINKQIKELNNLKLAREIVILIKKRKIATHAGLRKNLALSTYQYNRIRKTLETELGVALIYFGIFRDKNIDMTKNIPYELKGLLQETETTLRELTVNLLSQSIGGNSSIRDLLPPNVIGIVKKHLIKTEVERGLSRSDATKDVEGLLSGEISRGTLQKVLEQVYFGNYVEIMKFHKNWPHFSTIFSSLHEVLNYLPIIVKARNIEAHRKSDLIDIIPLLDSLLWFRLKTI